MQSLDPEYEGFNLDDFMRAMASLAAWNREGKPVTEHARNNLMLAKSDQPELNPEQMRAFNLVWAN